MPESISHLSPAEIEEERRIAEAFNAFLDIVSTPEPQPVALKPAPTAAAWKPHIPTMASTRPVASALAPEPTEQVGAGAPAEAVEPDVDPASVGRKGRTNRLPSVVPLRTISRPRPLSSIVVFRRPRHRPL